MPIVPTDTVGAAVIGAVAGAIATGLISYFLLRMQLATQIKVQREQLATQIKEQKEQFAIQVKEQRDQLATQIKAQVDLASAQAKRAEETERQRLLDSDRMNELSLARAVIARMTIPTSTTGPSKEDYYAFYAEWRATRGRLIQTFGEDTTRELVHQVDDYLRFMKGFMNRDSDAMLQPEQWEQLEQLAEKGRQLLRSTAPLLQNLHPGNTTSLSAPIDE
jgi:hypothetical protein